MSTLNKRKLYISLGVESAEAIVEAEVPNEGEGVMASHLDTVDEIQDFQDDVDTLDDFSDTVESTSDLAVAVESAIASGKGLTRIEAAALTKALKASAGKYIEIENNVVPGIESYDIALHDGNENTAHNKEQTKEASKGLKETIKAFIQAIIKKIKAIGLKFKNMIKSVTDRVGKIQQKLKNTADLLKNTPEFGKQEIKFNSLNLHIDGKFDGAAILSSLEDLKRIGSTLLGDNFSTEEQKFIDAGWEAVNKSDMSQMQKFVEGLNGFTLTTFASFSKKSEKLENGEYVSQQFPGGRQFKLNPGQPDTERQLSIIEFKRTVKGSEDYDEVVTAPDSRMLADMIDSVFELITKYRLQMGQGKGRQKESMIEIEKRLKNFDAKKDAEYSGDRKMITSITTYCSKEFALKLWLFDYCVLLVSNIADLTTKACAAAQSVKDAKDKEEAADNKEQAK